MSSVSVTHENGVDVGTTAPTPGTARATLLNILGDIVHPAIASVSTSVFIDVMGTLGHSEHAARQAISRCSNAGWIAGEKSGRTSRWRLTSSGITVVEEGITGVEQLSNPHADWDGRWRTVIVTISNEQRAVREGMYRALRWDGFGNPLPSVWVSPHPQHNKRVRTAIAASGLAPSTISFIGEVDGLGLTAEEIVSCAWDLTNLRELYTSLVSRFDAIHPATDEEHLVALLQLDQELQHLLVTDPQIPSSLTPGWTGRADAARLLQLRHRWHPHALRHWQAVLRRHT
jgi:phenylacetic acid degradation operon negative regulatory protein